MDSFSDPRLDDFRNDVRAWLATAIPETWRLHSDSLPEDERKTLRREWDRTLWRAGYAGLNWPAEFGGGGRGLLEQFVLYEEFAIAHAPDELDRIGKFLTGPAVIAYGTQEQKERFLPPILKGEELWCEGFSEPGAGSDLAAVSTTAVREGDHWVINGQKIWTTNADRADRCYLLVKTSNELRPGHNLTVFLIDMHQPGVEVVPINAITGEKHFSAVFFDGAIATDADILGELNEGWSLGKLTGFRAERHLVDAIVHYRELKEWSERLRQCEHEVGASDEDADRFDVELEMLRWHVMRATELTATGGDWYPPVSITKVFWSRLMQQLTEAGLALDCPEHRAYWQHRFLDARASTIYGGTIEIQRNVVANQVLGLPR
jgi:alkylation response protein AidB-like acyl-CoA dehydrogenase